MRLNKKILILTLLPLVLSSCGNEEHQTKYVGKNTSVPMLSSVTDYVPYKKNDKGEIVPLKEFVYPFNTSINLTVFYEEGTEEPVEIAEKFEKDMMRYHVLFDRHYYYKENGKDDVINNVRVINESYGTNEPIKVDKELFDILVKSKKMMEISEGKFNITIGNLSSLWDEYIDRASALFDRDDEYVNLSVKNQKIIYVDPDPAAVELARQSVLTVEELNESLVLDEKNSTVTFKAVPRLEELNLTPSITLGGIGKGEATELFSKSEMAKKHCARINSGTSSIKFTNQRIDGGKWGISFSNPVYYEKHLAVGMIEDIKLNPVEYRIEKDGSFGLSTSGYYQQYYFDKETGLRRHHIINPETGYSNYYTNLDTYEGSFDAITLLMDDAGLSDMYTTALMNTRSIEEAETLLKELNKGFGTDGVAFYFKRGKDEKDPNIQELMYVPESLDSSFDLVSDLKYPLATKKIVF